MSTIRPATFVSSVGVEILQEACNLLTTCLTRSTVESRETEELLDQILDLAARRRELSCQRALAITYGRLSQLRDCGKEVQRVVCPFASDLGINLVFMCESD